RCIYFFFQAEDGIRVFHVTGVQTCALPIYSKGVLERLTAFKELLIDYPKYHKKVVLVMIVVPSRTNVASYEKHKKKVDELVGNINTMFAVPYLRTRDY